MTSIHKYLKTQPNLTRGVVCYLISENKVILGLRKKVSHGFGANLIAGIGGKVGDKKEFKMETFDEALCREVQEEVGVTVTEFQKRAELIFLYPCNSEWDQFVIAYVVTGWVGELTETESMKPVVFPAAKLPWDRMWDDNRYFVPLILAGKNIRATFLFDKNNDKVIQKELSTVNNFEQS